MRRLRRTSLTEGHLSQEHKQQYLFASKTTKGQKMTKLKKENRGVKEGKGEKGKGMGEK